MQSPSGAIFVDGESSKHFNSAELVPPKLGSVKAAQGHGFLQARKKQFWLQLYAVHPATQKKQQAALITPSTMPQQRMAYHYAIRLFFIAFVQSRTVKHVLCCALQARLRRRLAVRSSLCR
jgi:hypothetical protein